MLRINSKHIITTRDDGLYVRPSTTHFYELYQPPHDVWRHLLSTQAQHLASTQTLITNNTNTTGRIYILASTAQGIVEKHGVVFLGYTRTWAGLFIFTSRNVFGSGVWAGVVCGLHPTPCFL
jgi:hypothetical protein